MFIDFHTHIFPPKIIDHRAEYLRRDPCFSTLYSNAKARLATAQELIASMDRAEVDLSVVLNIGWASHELCLETNDYIMEAVALYPGRLVGFGAIQPLAGEAALGEVERCAQGGLRGIGELRPDVQGFDLGDDVTMGPVARLLRQQQMILLTHVSEPVGHQYLGKGTVGPDILYRFISHFPEVMVVGAHWGGGLPFYALMPEVSQSLTNVWFDTAATTLLYQSQIFRLVAEMVGSDKILFGTDFPLLPQQGLIQEIRQLGLAPEVTEMILGRNAYRLLSLAAPGRAMPTLGQISG